MSIGLFEAIEQHDANRVAELLSQGADPNAAREQWPGWIPLHAAIEELDYGGSVEVVTLLLNHGADVNGWDAQHEATPLLMAIFRSNREAVRILLEAGANPNVRSGEGDSPLRWCVENGDRETAALLLQYGASKTIDEFGGACGYTALGMAARKLNLGMIDLLLDAGANPEALDEDYQTAREHVPPPGSVDERIRALAEAKLKRNDT